jgi:hypothetical protein
MSSTMGRPRVLTDAQVETVLKWHEEVLAWKALRKAIKTKHQLARELGVSVSTLSHVIAHRGQYKSPSPEKRAEEVSQRHHRLERLRTRGLL